MADLPSPGKDKISFTESLIWPAGEDGLESFYIYGLLSAGGTIFAFSEGRIERHDKSPHHIVLKKSLDGGISWGKTQLVVTARNNECFCNPTPIYERGSKKLFLFYAQNFENLRSKLFLISSSDDGESWSVPQNLTALFDRNPYGWTLHLPGPGHGIQMKNGRLLLQVWHRRAISFSPEERNYAVSVIFSDDAGKRWQPGGIIPPGTAQLNESRIVEITPGELMLNARSGTFVQSPRYFSKSFDGGLSWTEPSPVSSLPAAFGTDSGFANFQFQGRNCLLLTRPAATQKRKDLTAYLSEDGGSSYGNSKMIYEGFAGYSDAIVLANNCIGVIYGRELIDENGDPEGNAKYTVFAKFDMAWLKE